MEKEVTLRLTVEQLNVIIAGLVKLPIEVGLSTFQEVQQQIDEQIKQQQQSGAGSLSSKIIN